MIIGETLRLMLVTFDMKCYVLAYAAALLLIVFPGFALGEPAPLSQQLREEVDVTTIVQLIDEVARANDVNAVECLIGKLDDRRVVSASKTNSYLVCDVAGQCLQSMLKINHLDRAPFYMAATRRERDHALATWKSWWSKNKGLPPENWGKNYVASLINTLLECPPAQREQNSRALERALGTDFGMTNFTPGGMFGDGHEALFRLLQYWWRAHEKLPLADLRNWATQIEPIIEMAARYRSFVLSSRLRSIQRIDAIMTSDCVPGPSDEDFGALVRVVLSNDPKQVRAGAAELKRMIGTDFGIGVFSANDVFSREAACSRGLLRDWWDACEGLSAALIAERAQPYAVVFSLAERYAGMLLTTGLFEKVGR